MTNLNPTPDTLCQRCPHTYQDHDWSMLAVANTGAAKCSQCNCNAYLIRRCAEHDFCVLPHGHEGLPVFSREQRLSVEVIDITEYLTYCTGVAVDCLVRSDTASDPIAELKRAKDFIDREITRRSRA